LPEQTSKTTWALPQERGQPGAEDRQRAGFGGGGGDIGWPRLFRSSDERPLSWRVSDAGRSRDRYRTAGVYP